MRARPFVANYVSPSRTRRLGIQFFAASQRDAVRIAKRKAGKGLLLGLALAGVEPLVPEDAAQPRQAA
ncbi:MAG TPA: hypothetical protein VFA12_00235 [Stellaceae bacterium]|nr:hypothetical protein [Stellaceae bacterium]